MVRKPMYFQGQRIRTTLVKKFKRERKERKTPGFDC